MHHPYTWLCLKQGGHKVCRNIRTKEHVIRSHHMQPFALGSLDAMIDSAVNTGAINHVDAMLQASFTEQLGSKAHRGIDRTTIDDQHFKRSPVLLNQQTEGSAKISAKFSVDMITLISDNRMHDCLGMA